MGLEKKGDRDLVFVRLLQNWIDLSPFFRDFCFDSLLIGCLFSLDVYAGMLDFFLILCAYV